MMKAYLDESGHEQESGRMVIAGFAGTEQQWTEFDLAWRRAIHPRRNLHLTKLRFQKDRDRHLLERAGKLPEQFGLMPLACSVDFADYADLVAGTIDERLFSGYIACLHPLVTNILRGLPSGETVELVFERQDWYSGLADIALGALTSIPYPEFFLPNGEHKLSGWRWAEKTDACGIEAADYLAFALLQSFRDASSKKAQWCAPILPSDGEVYGFALDRETVRRIVCGAQQLHRARVLWRQTK